MRTQCWTEEKWWFQEFSDRVDDGDEGVSIKRRVWDRHTRKGGRRVTIRLE